MLSDVPPTVPRIEGRRDRLVLRRYQVVWCHIVDMANVRLLPAFGTEIPTTANAATNITPRIWAIFGPVLVVLK